MVIFLPEAINLTTIYLAMSQNPFPISTNADLMVGRRYPTSSLFKIFGRKLILANIFFCWHNKLVESPIKRIKFRREFARGKTNYLKSTNIVELYTNDLRGY